MVPDVIGVARLVRGTVHVVAIAETIHVGATKCRADRDVAEYAPERLQEIPADSLTCLDGQFRVVRDVCDAVGLGNLGVQEIPHPVMLRESLPTEGIQRAQNLAVGLDRRTARAIHGTVLAADLPGKPRTSAVPLLERKILELIGIAFLEGACHLRISNGRLLRQQIVQMSLTQPTQSGQRTVSVRLSGNRLPESSLLRLPRLGINEVAVLVPHKRLRDWVGEPPCSRKVSSR